MTPHLKQMNKIMISTSTTPTRKHVQTLDKPQILLLQLKGIHRTWRGVSKALDDKIPAGTLSSYAKGRPILNPKHRAIFGLPSMLPAPVCPRCGVVHIRKTCPTKHTTQGDLFSLKPSVLLWKLKNREEF